MRKTTLMVLSLLMGCCGTAWSQEVITDVPVIQVPMSERIGSREALQTEAMQPETNVKTDFQDHVKIASSNGSVVYYFTKPDSSHYPWSVKYKVRDTGNGASASAFLYYPKSIILPTETSYQSALNWAQSEAFGVALESKLKQ